jgi:DNA-binding NarL/FixJ family response regulator
VVGSLVVDGNRYLVVTLAEPPAEAKPTTVERLTRRELEIAVLIAAGKVNKQIAYQLGISTWTVATYVRRIYCKLGVTNRAEMTAKLITAIMKQ